MIYQEKNDMSDINYGSDIVQINPEHGQIRIG